MHAIKIILVLQLLSVVLSRPITVNDGDYSKNYEVVEHRPNYEISERKPNSHYNRLPQNAQIDEFTNDDDDGDVDYEDQTDRPVSVQNANYQSSNNYYNGYNGLLTENKIKIKRRKKKVKRPCLPIQSLGSPLFTNRLKRDAIYEDGKTFGALLGGYGGGYPYYGGAAYPSYAGNYPSYASTGPVNFPRPQQGNFQNYNRPQQDNYNTPLAQFGKPQYNHFGGYPCIPVSYGHVPHFGAGAGAGGGGLGFFGNGGLLDFSSANPSLSYPQTVVINRPPLFGNRPSFDSNRPSSSGGGVNDQNQSGFWGTVVDKLQEFVSN